MTQLWSVTCHMGSHSITCYPTQVNTPRLNPSHTGQYSIYLPRRDGRLCWPSWLIVSRPGVEPATFRSRVQCSSTAPPRQPLSMFSSSWRQSCIDHWTARHHPTRPPTVVWRAVQATSAVVTDPSAGCPPVAVCNCWRLSPRHCWCSVVEQFASRHCCMWHTSTVPPRT